MKSRYVPRGKDYKEALDKQTKLWLRGKSVHNKKYDECCPDFSCCKPKLKAPKEVRQVFYNAYLKKDRKTQDRMLMEFLVKLIDSIEPKKKVYDHIIGLGRSRREIE